MCTVPSCSVRLKDNTENRSKVKHYRMKLKDLLFSGVTTLLVVAALMGVIILTSDCDLILWAADHFGKSPGEDHLVGLVVKVSTSRAEDPGFESRLQWDFSGSSHTSDLKIGTPVATLPEAWLYRVSAGTGQPGVSIL